VFENGEIISVRPCGGQTDISDFGISEEKSGNRDFYRGSVGGIGEGGSKYCSSLDISVMTQ